ncbi:MAG: hypothetical protein LBH87_01040 [Coriobacteriales bacterium]|jgi:hypothetical protein|nr:hypothetical protein [Coriobacteriales bacterium]
MTELKYDAAQFKSLDCDEMYEFDAGAISLNITKLVTNAVALGVAGLVAVMQAVTVITGQFAAAFGTNKI